MNLEELKKSIVSIIKEIEPAIDFDDTTDLLEEQILDSMGVVYLLAEFQATLGIDIPYEEITIENFSSLVKIVELVNEYSGK